MASLSSAGNVYNPCLRLLRERGYRLWVEELADSYLWCAEKNGFDFSADNPIELLGLVALYEAKQPTTHEPYGWYIKGEDISDELIENSHKTQDTNSEE